MNGNSWYCLYVNGIKIAEFAAVDFAVACAELFRDSMLITSQNRIESISIYNSERDYSHDFSIMRG